MKKSFSAAAFLATLSLVACGKSGTISGTVIDPFTGKAVELPTVFIKDTPFTSQKVPGGLKDGAFKFEKIKPGTYTITAGKNKYSKTNIEFTVAETALDVKQDLYIYSREGLTPGMYQPVSGAAAEKIANAWVNSEATCKESITALRPKYMQNVENKATKKVEKNEVVLPAAKKTATSMNVLFYNASSVSSPIEAVAYPASEAKASEHADCKGIDAKETTLIVPQKDKSVQLSVAYKSENLYEISGTLPKGKVLVTFHQDGKLLKTYYFDAQ